MKKTILALVLAAGLTSFAGNAKASTIVSTYNYWTNIPAAPENLALGKQVTLCDGNQSGALNPNSHSVSALTDGIMQSFGDDPGNSVFGADGNTIFRVSIDLGNVSQLSEIDSFSWHVGDRAPQHYIVWGAATPSVTGTSLTFSSYNFDSLSSAGYSRIAEVDTVQNTGQWTASITSSSGSNLGNYRYLVFDISPASGPSTSGNGTFYGEITVKGSQAVPEPSTYALFGLGALALVIAYRRKVA
jgi:hypothetical protein